MGELILDSLEIQQFRAFDQLQIERLGRVNLITGKNNVGKSCLLEAVRVYAQSASPSLLWDILDAHDENKIVAPIFRGSIVANANPFSLKRLIHQGKSTSEHSNFSIGTIDQDDQKLRVTIEDVARIVPNDSPFLTIRRGQEEDLISISQLIETEHFMFPSAPATFPCIAIKPHGLDSKTISSLWDNVALQTAEDEILGALRLIAPGVEGLNFIGDPQSTSGERIPMVKVRENQRLPLRSLGDGMERMLGIALALVNAKDGILLIDEIENGLHYIVQPDLWQLIFQVAQRLNVQVFATTHSWDCIEGFQKAAQEGTDSEGMLIRLEYKKDKIVPTLFDERRLTIATREQIEVR